jgi:uridine kinase
MSLFEATEYVKIRNGHRSLAQLADSLSALIQRVFERRSSRISIAVGGPGGTGKSILSAVLAAALPEATVLPLDDYKTSRWEREEKGLSGPHPEANKMDLIGRHLGCLKSGEAFDRPVYNSEVGDADTTEVFRPGRFNIVDGETSTYPDFRDLVDFSIFVDSDLRTQLETRITRDIEELSYTWEKAIVTFLQSNLREFPQFGAKSKEWADVHLFCGEDYHLEWEAVSKEWAPFLEEPLASRFCRPD